MVQQGGLGRGLSSLIPNKNKISDKSGVKNKQKKGVAKDVQTVKPQQTGEVNYFGRGISKSAQVTGLKKSQQRIIEEEILGKVLIKQIVPNPYQPRKNFNQNKLDELANSIKEHGIIQPLVVTKQGSEHYELIAGERRLEAAKLAGLTKVPVVIKRATSQNKAEWALIENVQRHNLNPIEEAKAYQQMQEKFGLTQEEIAQKVGKSRSVIANIMRLLKLPIIIQEALITERITEGHARAILAIDDRDKQLDLFRSILKDKLNVREVEKVTKKVKLSGNFKIKKEIDPDLLNLENRVAEYLNTKVKIRGIKDNGQIIIDYYSPEELGEIVKKIEK